MLANASGNEEETSQWCLHSNTDNEASSRVLHGQQNTETVVKKLMNDVFIARQWCWFSSDVSWKPWLLEQCWQKRHVGTGLQAMKKKFTNDVLHSNTGSEASSQVLHGPHNAEAAVKKPMSDVFTAKLMMIEASWQALHGQQNEYRNCCEETYVWCLHSKTYEEVSSRILQRQLNGQQVVLPLLVHHCKQTEITQYSAGTLYLYQFIIH